MLPEKQLLTIELVAFVVNTFLTVGIVVIGETTALTIYLVAFEINTFLTVGLVVIG